jgi:hypothetical protein
MTPAALRFQCSICADPSAEICAWCTKDTCPNHRCERCLCCSDCCRCEVRLEAGEPMAGGNGTEAEELAAPGPIAVS